MDVSKQSCKSEGHWIIETASVPGEFLCNLATLKVKIGALKHRQAFVDRIALLKETGLYGCTGTVVETCALLFLMKGSKLWKNYSLNPLMCIDLSV